MNNPNATPLQPVPKFSETNLVKLEYNGIEVNLNEDGWFNATKAADLYGKRLDVWLKTDETKAYINALMEELNLPKEGGLNTTKRWNLIQTKRGKYGGGTWLHPRLAVVFARWLDVRFAIWCDVQIDKLIRGNHPHYDWKRIRHEASSSFKVMNAVLQLVRQTDGKETKHFHYANEAKLVNWALTGEFKKIDREQLHNEDLNLLAKLEERNSVMLGVGLDRDTRKAALQKFIADNATPLLTEGGACHV